MANVEIIQISISSFKTLTKGDKENTFDGNISFSKILYVVTFIFTLSFRDKVSLYTVQLSTLYAGVTFEYSLTKVFVYLFIYILLQEMHEG